MSIAWQQWIIFGMLMLIALGYVYYDSEES